MNKVCMTGRLTKDPVYNSYDNSNNGFSNFVIAVTRPNTKNEISDFFSCIVWKEKAEYTSKYIKKGDLVGITGVLQTRSYEDKNTHEKRVMTEIYVEQIELLSSVNKNNNSNNNNRSNNNGGFGEEEQKYEPFF